MVFLLSLDRRGGREWSGRRKSRLLSPSVRLRALFRGFALAPGMLPTSTSPSNSEGYRSDRLSEYVRRSLQTLADVGELSRREVDAFLLRFRAGLLAIGLPLLAVGPLAHRLELSFHCGDRAGESGQLASDAGDVRFG